MTTMDMPPPETMGDTPEPAWQSLVEKELDGLYQLPGVLSVILAGRDGVLRAAVPAGRSEANRLAAMVAAVRGTSEIATDEVGGGEFQQALLRSDRSEIFCVAVGEDYVLSVLAEKGALTGLLFMAVETAAQRLLETVSGA